jgi:hypothetical protein
MLLWFFMVLGWVLVLVLAISLFRLVSYADRKVRMRSLRMMRERRRRDQVA